MGKCDLCGGSLKQYCFDCNKVYEMGSGGTEVPFNGGMPQGWRDDPIDGLRNEAREAERKDMTKPENVDRAPVHAVVHQRFQDQIDADGFAEAFLVQQFSRYEPWILEVRWWNLEGDDGRVGGLFAGGKIVASVTVTRDAMNWSEVCGVAFV